MKGFAMQIYNSHDN